MSETVFSKNPDLNPRLLKITQLIPKCHTLADIGTDHAYIPIWSIANGISSLAIASDINKGPVERARQNVKAFGLTDKISLRLGAGLSTVSEGEADVIVIAGMGGILISNILDSKIEVAKSAKTIILQPMTAVFELREYLLKNGFSIFSEHLVSEDKKIYNIICAGSGKASDYTEKDLILGKDLLKTSPQLFDAHKKNIIQKYKKRLAGLQRSDLNENKLAALEAERIIELLK